MKKKKKKVTHPVSHLAHSRNLNFPTSNEKCNMWDRKGTAADPMCRSNICPRTRQCIIVWGCCCCFVFRLPARTSVLFFFFADVKVRFITNTGRVCWYVCVKCGGCVCRSAFFFFVWPHYKTHFESVSAFSTIQSFLSVVKKTSLLHIIWFSHIFPRSFLSLWQLSPWQTHNFLLKPCDEWKMRPHGVLCKKGLRGKSSFAIERQRLSLAERTPGPFLPTAYQVQS